MSVHVTQNRMSDYVQFCDIFTCHVMCAQCHPHNTPCVTYCRSQRVEKSHDYHVSRILTDLIPQFINVDMSDFITGKPVGREKIILSN